MFVPLQKGETLLEGPAEIYPIRKQHWEGLKESLHPLEMVERHHSEAIPEHKKS